MSRIPDGQGKTSIPISATTGTNPNAKSADDDPICSVLIGHGTFVHEYLAKEYQIEDNVLQLSDGCSITIANPDGIHTGEFTDGDPMEIYLISKTVAGGKKIRRLRGRVTSIESVCDLAGGCELKVKGADLGWHLLNTPGQLFFNLRDQTFASLFKKVLDPSWNIDGVSDDNTRNTRLNQGSQSIGVMVARGQLSSEQASPTTAPRIQFEPGQMIGETLILYAKRARRLVNMSSDGKLLIFSPRTAVGPSPSGDDSRADCKVRLFKAGSKRASETNVLARPTPPRLTTSIDGLYSATTCVWQRFINRDLKNSRDPNQQSGRAKYKPATSPLPFARVFTFTDGDALSEEMAKNRARWKYERGLFDSWQYEVTLRGNIQGGLFFASDTLVDVEDEINKIKGLYYVAGVRLCRTIRDGTYTVLQIRKEGLLRA